MTSISSIASAAAELGDTFSGQLLKPSDADYAAKRDQIRDQLLLSKQQERFGMFVSSLVDQMTRSGKIKRNEEEINALKRSGSEQGM